MEILPIAVLTKSKHTYKIFIDMVDKPDHQCFTHISKPQDARGKIFSNAIQLCDSDFTTDEIVDVVKKIRATTSVMF